MGKTEKRNLSEKISTYREIDVYRMAMDSAMSIFKLTKKENQRMINHRFSVSPFLNIGG